MLVLGVLLGLLGIVLSMRIWAGYPRKPEGIRFLSAAEHAFLSAAGDSLFPEGGAIPLSGTQAGIPAYIDDYLSRIPAHMRRLVHMLFFLMEHATIFFPTGFPSGLRRFTELSDDQRLAYFRSWDQSRHWARRFAFFSLRSILAMAYFGDPGVMRALDLAPKHMEVPVREADLLWPPIGQPRSALRYGAEDLSPPHPLAPLDPDAPLHASYEAPTQ